MEMPGTEPSETVQVGGSEQFWSPEAGDRAKKSAGP